MFGRFSEQAHQILDLGREEAERYRRAVELDPDFDKAWYQLIHALAALGDNDEMIALHQRRLAEAPQELREHRFLAEAYLVAGRSDEAREVIDAGLRLAPTTGCLSASAAR